MKSKAAVIVVSIVITFIIGIILDAALLSHKVPWLVHLIAIKPGLLLFGTMLNLPKFDIVIPTILALSVTFLWLISWRNLSKETILQSTKDLGVVALLLLGVPFFLILGNFIYSLCQDYIPKTAQKVVEAFGLTTKIYFNGGSDEFVTLPGSLASILGIALGIYLLFHFGMKRFEK